MPGLRRACALPCLAALVACAGAEPPGAITGLTVDANPNSVLSVFARWTTDRPASSTVQFGAGRYEWELGDAALVTDHRVLVIGLRHSQSYQLRAISRNAGGAASAEETFTTGPLPPTIPVATVTVHDQTRTQPGWTLMNIQKGDGTARAQSNDPAQAVMYDADGQPVWYATQGVSPDGGGAISTQLTDRGVLIGAVTDQGQETLEPPREVDFAGDTIWACATPTCGTGGQISHHAQKLPNGHYVVMSESRTNGVTCPSFVELDPTQDDAAVWRLDYCQLVPPPAGATGDWCHGNAVTIDIARNAVYANCRWVGLIKATYQNPTLVWHLPAAYGAKGLGTMTFVPAAAQFSDTHDPEIHDDGTILFFDNGGWSGIPGEEGNPHGFHSRAVAYQIDETARTATRVWEFPGAFTGLPSWYTNDFYVPFWGDADRLPNRNVLVTAGRRGTSSGSRVFEVAADDGQVVWELRLPPDFGVYRADRITPPLVRAIGNAGN